MDSFDIVIDGDLLVIVSKHDAYCEVRATRGDAQYRVKLRFERSRAFDFADIKEVFEGAVDDIVLEYDDNMIIIQIPQSELNEFIEFPLIKDPIDRFDRLECTIKSVARSNPGSTLYYLRYKSGVITTNCPDIEARIVDFVKKRVKDIIPDYLLSEEVFRTIRETTNFEEFYDILGALQLKDCGENDGDLHMSFELMGFIIYNSGYALLPSHKQDNSDAVYNHLSENLYHKDEENFIVKFTELD